MVLTPEQNTLSHTREKGCIIGLSLVKEWEYLI